MEFVNFVKYNPITKEIINYGVCDELDILSQGSNVLRGIGFPETHYVVNNEIVSYTESQVENKRNKPSYIAIWSNDLMDWVDNTPILSLNKHKQNKWEEIKFKRSEAEFSTFVWRIYEFDSDDISQSRIQGAVILAMQAQLAAQPFSIDWTLFDNSVITLSAVDMIEVGQALAIHVNTQHTIARQLRIALNQANTKEAVQAITWPRYSIAITGSYTLTGKSTTS